MVAGLAQHGTASGKAGLPPGASLGAKQTVCHHVGRTWKGQAASRSPGGDGIWEKTSLAKFCFRWPLTSGGALIHMLILLASYAAPFCLIGKLHTNPKTGPPLLSIGPYDPRHIPALQDP